MRRFVYIGGMLLIMVSCGRSPKQLSEESKSIGQIIDMLRMYSIIHSNGFPTNLQQLYEGVPNRSYPYGWHKDFKRYGKHAGFKTSFFEKYWFFPPDTTSQVARAEVILMSAQPYPFDAHGLGRSLIVKCQDRYEHCCPVKSRGIAGFAELVVLRLVVLKV